MKANSKFVNKDDGVTNLLPMAIVIVIGFAILFVGFFVHGEIRQALTDSYPAAASRTPIQNDTLSTQDNITENSNSALDIVQIVIIITLLAAAIGAIFMFTRYG